MTLEETINQQLANAMKAQDKLRTETLRSIRSGIIEFQKSGAGREMNTDDELKLLNKLVKNHKDSIELYKVANRNDLVEQEQKELEIIMEFLPKQMTDDEIKAEIKKMIEEQNATKKDFGKIMQIAMKTFAGKVDGSKVQAILKELLN
ncbi:MAG TPA: GatB/YqeY domain-containing protein [Candidatus Kapabacteria bacterium]|nr:GatB/YqeY domain-containing protein [Candidatus Kapabacteria bacterium]